MLQVCHKCDICTLSNEDILVKLESISVLKSDICTLSNEDILVKLESKQRHLEELVDNFTIDSMSSDGDKGEQHVQFALNKATLHVCRIVHVDKAILFPDVYKVFSNRFLVI